MNQTEIYDNVYEKNDTLWDNSDQKINRIINSDFKNKLDDLRTVHAKGFALNLGSGTASNLIELNQYCENVVCIDISKTGLKKAKEKYSLNEYVLADATKLPFKSKTFDYIEGIAILHHIENYKKSLVELKHCSKTGSYMLFVEPGILNPQAFIVRKIFPTPFHVPEEKPFIPHILKKTIKGIYGSNSCKILHFNVLTYGGSLIIKANKLTIPICKIARVIDRIIEKNPVFSQFCGQMIILIRNR